MSKAFDFASSGLIPAMKCIYVCPEDISSSILSGGHIESLCDIFYLSQDYREVNVFYPCDDSSSVEPSVMFFDIQSKGNVNLFPVQRSNSLISYLFLSFNRIGINHFFTLVKNAEIASDPKQVDLIVGCHRNVHIQLAAHLYGIANNIFLKSYGSIWIHNADNIWSHLRIGIINLDGFKRLLSMFFYIFLEAPSFVLCKKVFVVKTKEDTRKTALGIATDLAYGGKTIYNSSSPFFYFKENLCLANRDLGKLKKDLGGDVVLGHIGDNNFPTALHGMFQIAKSMPNAYSRRIVFKIAGKISCKNKRLIQLAFSRFSFIDLMFLGYVESVDDFYSSLDGLVVPVSGGSAMPIKAIESFVKFEGPILVTEYVLRATEGYVRLSNNTCVSSNTPEFLSNFVEE